MAAPPEQLQQHTGMLRPPNRTVATLFAGVAFAATAQFAAVTVGAIVAVDATDSSRWTGAPAATTILGTALGAFVLGGFMERHGRRIGLTVGWLVALAGAFVATLATRDLVFWMLLAGMAMMGIGNSASQLARYAAAETVPTRRQGSAISWVVWAAAVGAIVGPLSLGPAGHLAEAAGQNESMGGFVVAACMLTCAALISRVLPAGSWQFTSASTPAANENGSPDTVPAEARVNRSIVRAVMALAMAQGTMVAVMAITPAHLSHAGHSYGVIGTVMSSHFVGMFAFAPVVGWAVDRIGTERSIPLGLLVLAGGALIAALQPADQGALLSIPLWIVGIGWAIAFVSASKVVAAELTGQGKARIQGRIDSSVWVVSATASFGSGLLFAATSYATVAILAMAVAVLVGAGVFRVTRPHQQPAS